MGLGRVEPQDPGEGFCMTVLALQAQSPRQRRIVTAWSGVACHVEQPVSKPRRAGRPDWPHHQRCPHTHMWLASEMRQVYDRHFGPDWPGRADTPGSGTRLPRSTMPNCGDAPDAAREACFRRAACGSASAEQQGRECRQRLRKALQLRCAHHRLRATLRNLLKRATDDGNIEGTRGARQRSAGVRPVHLRGQVAPG